MIARSLHALTVDLRGIRTLTDWRALVVALCDVEGPGHADDSSQLPLRDPVVARIAAARARLASAPRLHQAALFDRRAEQAAAARLEVTARLDAALAHRAASLGPARSHPGHARLVAAWPLVSS